MTTQERQATHLVNLVNECNRVRTGNPFVYWSEKMVKADRIRVAEILGVSFNWGEVLMALQVVSYASTNRMPQETNSMEYE